MNLRFYQFNLVLITILIKRNLCAEKYVMYAPYIGVQYLTT